MSQRLSRKKVPPLLSNVSLNKTEEVESLMPPSNLFSQDSFSTSKASPEITTLSNSLPSTASLDSPPTNQSKNRAARRINSTALNSESIDTSGFPVEKQSGKIEPDVLNKSAELSNLLPTTVESNGMLPNDFTRVNRARRSKPEIQNRTRIPSIQGVLGLYSSPRSSTTSDILGVPDSYLNEEEVLVEEEEKGEKRSLSKEELWYFLRALVGQELEGETGELWKVTGVDVDDPSSTSAPIFRYLIKNFLLTLPLARSPTESLEEDDSLWTKGIQPLLNSLHQADLSHPIDIGLESTKLSETIYGAFERFLSSGLKVTFGSSDSRSEDDEGPTPTPPQLMPFLRSNERSMSSTSTLKIATTKELVINESVSPTVESPATDTLGTRIRGFSLGFLQKKSPPLSGKDISLPRPLPSPPLTSNVRATIDSQDYNEDASTSVDSHQSLASAEFTQAGEVSSSWFSWLPATFTSEGNESRSEEHGESSDEVVEFVDEEEEDPSEESVETTKPSTPSVKEESEPLVKSYIQFPASLPPLARNRSSQLNSFPLDSSLAASRRVPSVYLPQGIPLASLTSSVKYLEKSGVDWPFGAQIQVHREMKLDELKWGGFEVDIVGVRSGFFTLSPGFILRVRRPGRLDEFVVRTEAQFVKYHRVIDKEFPEAHIRRIPITLNPREDVQLPGQSLSRRHTTTANASSASNRLEAIPEMTKVETRSSTSTIEALPINTTGSLPISFSTSAFARQLRDQSVLPKEDSSSYNKIRADSKSRLAPHRAYSLIASPTPLSSTDLGKELKSTFDVKQPHDSQRRSLRNWLRDVIAIRGVGHHDETAEFLLLGSIVPTESNYKDIRNRTLVDDARKQVRLALAEGASERLKIIHALSMDVRKEFIHGNGFVLLSDCLRNVSSIERLPVRYLKAIEWSTFGLAESIHEMFVTSEKSSDRFNKFKAVHSVFPYFFVRQALKISNPKRVGKVLEEILLARPFGGKSLLQKLLAILLDDEPAQIAERIKRSRLNIGNQVMVDKLDIFVRSTKERKELIRTFAVNNHIELVEAIVRGGDAPKLTLFELDRVASASKSYRLLKRNGISSTQDDAGVRLVLELKNYLRLISRERDAALMRTLLGSEAFASSLERIVEPLMEFVRRTYKVGNASEALINFEKAMDQFIVVIEALRSRVQEPSKSIRVIINLLSRHQQPLYNFISSVHRSETIVEEFLQWTWTASIFIKRGLAHSIDLETILSSTNKDSEDQEFLHEEIEDLVSYHKQKRMRKYQDYCRLLSGDVDADSPIIVQGDGEGRSQLEFETEKKLRLPRLEEIRNQCLDAFKAQIRKIFAV